MTVRSFPFTKMHGLGNDFVILDEVTSTARNCRGLIPKEVSAELSRRICDRRFGVGCDQILRLLAPMDGTKAQVRMEIHNADGSHAEMCGNGIRAAALYLNRYWKPEKELKIETLAGLQIVTMESTNRIRVDMGAPLIAADKSEKLDFLVTNAGRTETQSLSFWEVSMGNPHAVFFVSNAELVPLEAWGPVIERHPRFSKRTSERTNVEFVEVLSPKEIRIRVWERGAGVTLACGTGACASVVAARKAGKVEQECQVELPGGELQIEWSGGQASVFMTGPAEEVFFGQFEAVIDPCC